MAVLWRLLTTRIKGIAHHPLNHCKNVEERADTGFAFILLDVEGCARIVQAAFADDLHGWWRRRQFRRQPEYEILERYVEVAGDFDQLRHGKARRAGFV